jgi:hypothetical protein
MLRAGGVRASNSKQAGECIKLKQRLQMSRTNEFEVLWR